MHRQKRQMAGSALLLGPFTSPNSLPIGTREPLREICLGQHTSLCTSAMRETNAALIQNPCVVWVNEEG